MDACDMPGIVSRSCERTEHNILWPPLHFVWEFLFAYLDYSYIVTTPERTGTVYSLIQNALWHHVGIRIHQGKTKVWNRAGEKPAVCDTLESMARAADPRASFWRGSEVPTNKQGMKVLGTPCGYRDFIKSHLDKTGDDHQILLDRIPLLDNLQSSWLLLVHCAGARANYLTRVVQPDAALVFCQRHDVSMWRCFSAFAQIEPGQPQDVRDTASMPLAPGGLRLRTAVRGSKPAFWASWADCMPMIRQQHSPLGSAENKRPLS